MENPNKFDGLKEEFESFKGSIARMRWFMITAVLISVLIFLHIYLEKFGFQDQQLATSFENRVRNYIKPAQDCYRDLALHRQKELSRIPTAFPAKTCREDLIPKKDLDDIKQMSANELLHEYSKREYKIKLTDKTLDEAKLQIRHLPLLGIEVPANDFVIVMSVMSLVFVTGVWINLRGVSAALTALARHENPEVMRLAKLNTVFMTSLENDRGHTLAKATRSLVIWLPFLAIVFATIVGYWDVIAKLLGPNAYHYGSMPFVMSHLFFAIVVIGTHLWIAIECKIVLRDIDGHCAPVEGKG